MILRSVTNERSDWSEHVFHHVYGLSYLGSCWLLWSLPKPPLHNVRSVRLVIIISAFIREVLGELEVLSDLRTGVQ